MKKITLASWCLFISMNCMAIPLYDQKNFDFQFRALIAKPSTSNLNYGAEALSVPLPSPSWKIYDIDPHYHFGFDLKASSFIQSRDTQLRIHWMHFSHDDSACNKVSESNFMTGPFFEIGPDALLYKKNKGRVAFHYDAAAVHYGQLFCVSDALYANLFVGVDFMHLTQKLKATFSNPENTVVRIIGVPTQFNGAGPQCGIDLFYTICNNFYLTGKAAASLLVGKMNNHTTFLAFSPALAELGITPPNKQYICTSSKTEVVPGFDLQLGLSYFFTLACNYTIQLEAGYQALVYIDALQSVDLGSEVNTPPVAPDTIGVFARTFKRTISNFALNGAYVAIGTQF